MVLVIRGVWVALSTLLQQHKKDGERGRKSKWGVNRRKQLEGGQQCQSQGNGFLENRGAECCQEAGYT